MHKNVLFHNNGDDHISFYLLHISSIEVLRKFSIAKVQRIIQILWMLITIKQFEMRKRQSIFFDKFVNLRIDPKHIYERLTKK